MSKLKKILATVTAVMTLTVSGISVSAQDTAIGNGNSASDKVVVEKKNGDVTYEYSISDLGISINQYSKKRGIVLQPKKGADINSLGLKYDFEHKNSVYLMGFNFKFDQNSVWNYQWDGFDADDLYIYLTDTDTPEEELISYAEELSQIDEVLYANEFELHVYDSGHIENSAKDKCCIYIYSDKTMTEEEMKKYVKQLNSNEELMNYLKSIGADEKITLNKTYNMPCISGIDDNRTFFEIQKELEKFDDIDHASYISVMQLTPTGGLKFAEHKDTTNKKNDVTETPKGGLVVTGMYDNGVLLDYAIYLSNDEFKHMSGTDYKLKYGDVITTNCNELIVTMPAQFCIKEDTYAKYIGTVTEIYKDSITDLTVTKKESDSSYFELQDSSGNIYQWSTYLPYGSRFMGDSACVYNIDPHDVNIGDVLSCAVTENAFGKEVVLMPVSVVSKTDNPGTPSDDTTVQIGFKSGDANGDDTLNVRDCFCIANAVANKTADSLPDCADYNNDGYKNIRDAAAIARELAAAKSK